MTHFQFFQRFWDNEIRKYLSEKTNLHLKHETGKSIIVTEDEIEVLFGIQMTMAIVRMSQHEVHWPPEFLFNKIRSAMTLKRYILVRRFSHANDNTKKTNPENINDKLFKVHPLLDLVRNNCIKVEPEQCHSIDEQIIPAKTKRSGGVKQYYLKKFHKWGFKNMIKARQSGMINDFFIYGKKHSAGTERCGAEESALRLVEKLLKHKSFRVYLIIGS